MRNQHQKYEQLKMNGFVDERGSKEKRKKGMVGIRRANGRNKTKPKKI
jgi:hypothetical protein